MTTPGPAASIVERLAAIAPKSGVSLVIRHAEREAIPPDAFGNDAPLTLNGVTASEMLGAALSGRGPVNLVSSPVKRCVQTADAILRGAGSSAAVTTDRRLGNPGPFIIDPNASGPLFLELPVSEIVRRQLRNAEPPPGMRRTDEGVEILLNLVTGNLGEEERLDVFVTHDVILAVLASSIIRLPQEEAGWPGYLDGLLLWRSGGELHLAWKGNDYVLSFNCFMRQIRFSSLQQ